MKFSIKRNKQAVIGIACGALCALCVGLYVMQVNDQASAAQQEILARYGGDQVEVCVAKRDIAAGQTITESDVETKMWIASLLPADAIVEKSDAVGQQVGSSILAGEVISSARFGFDASEIDVPDGMVALSVPARAVQAVGGALSVGMKVDVYAVGANSTTRVAQSVSVLETCATEESSSSSWVTLALPPEKVAEMVSAAENLELYFVLPSESAADADVSAVANASSGLSSSGAASSDAADASAQASSSSSSSASNAASSASSSSNASSQGSSSGSAASSSASASAKSSSGEGTDGASGASDSEGGK